MVKIVLQERPDLTEDNENIKILAYQKWIDNISEEYKTELNPSDIVGSFFLRIMNNLLKIASI